MSILKPGNLLAAYSENAQSSTLLQLYKSFIRPHMEYCSSVWDPHLTKDTMLLENAQKFGLRVCLKDWSSSYEELLCKANLPPPPPPSERCSLARVCHMHKIIHDFTDFPEVPMERLFFHYSSRANNTLSIVPYNCHTTQFLNSYFPRTAADWNSLPTDVVTLNSTASFKHAVIEHKLT